MNLETFLSHSRRQIVRAVAIGVLGSAGIVGVVAGVMLVLAPSAGLVVLLALMLLDLVAGAAALWLIDRRQLWHSTMLLAGVLTLGIIAVGVFFPDIKISAAPILIIVTLLVSLIGRTSLTIGSVVVCALLAIGIVATPAAPGMAMEFGALLPLVQAASAGSVIVLVWLIVHRLIASLTVAIGLASHRATEAEAARAEAEATRLEIEQRSIEQQRLLDLVQALELPVITISQGVLVTPLIGNLDNRRVEAIQRRLLEMVTERGAHTVVLDVTGINVIDTLVARRLLLTAQAVRLLGARTLLSGMSAHVAQTLVGLGVTLDDLQPVRDLSQALEAAQHR